MRIVVQHGRCVVPRPVRDRVRTALRAAGAALKAGPGDVVLRFVDAGEIRSLKKTWFGEDRPTDVLSFPSGVDPAGRRHWGDIALCWDVARRQALRGRRRPEREAAILAVHGLLHLLGYDHETDDGEMAALERRLRRALFPATRRS